VTPVVGAPCRGWLAGGRRGAICLSIDDVHPSRASDDYEAGGDLDGGVLGRLERLLAAHPGMRATLFVTPDWRERSPVPSRRVRAAVPLLRHHLHLTAPLPAAARRLDRHPGFVEHLRSQPRFELAGHGLTHLARGLRPPEEFARVGRRRAGARLRRSRALFAAAGLPVPDGFGSPAWTGSRALLTALADSRFRWVSCARDIVTEPSPGARTAGSGLHGVALTEPHWLLGGRLVHLPVNFQATSSDERALRIVDGGGLLSIKAHAVKDALGHIALDGLDDAYCERLDRLLTRLHDAFGDALWRTSMGAVAAHAWSAPA
jgi:peptidoglycan/xylan/chitin deacetylase (PgdA/CDA1 family)